MKTYNDVYEEYKQFKTKFPDDPTPIEEYAKQKDEILGVKDRAEAYEPSLWKTVSSAIDRGFAYTPDPSIIASPADVGAGFGKLVGGGFDRLAGTHVAPTVEAVGRDVPRMVTEGLLTAPMGGAGVVPRVLSTLGKVAGYVSAFARGAAETDNLAGGAISAGALRLGNVLIPGVGGTAERGLTRLLERGTKDFVPGQVLEASPALVRQGVGGLANVAAGVGTATGINEATRQGMLTAMPDEKRVEGDRNPFTQENIAGNVAGAAFFLPQLMTSLMKGGPRVSPKQVEQLGEHLKAQETGAVPRSFGEDIPGGAESGIVGKTRTPEQAQEHLLTSLEQDIVNRRLAAEDGREDITSRLDKTIEERYNELVSGRYSPIAEANRERLAQAVKTVDDTVKFQPPDTPEKFSELAKMIKDNLDFLNEGRVRYEQELAQRESVLNVNDKKQVAEFERWKAEQARRGTGQAGQEQTWHPQARASQVLDRLWKSGDLPPLSEDWMKSEWNATFDESGSPQFSNQVLAQKMSNYFADKLDAATKAESAARKAETAGDAKVNTVVEQRYADFIGALNNLPKELIRPVALRSVELAKSERVDQRTGQQVTRLPQWHRAVIRAVSSYDPATQTILLSKAGKPGEGPQYYRAPIKELLTWMPQERRVTVGEGGKSATKIDSGHQVAEGNIEALKKPSGDQYDIADEEAFKRALAEQSDMPFGERTDLALDPENRLLDPALDVIDESGQQAEAAVGEKMKTKETVFKKNLTGLSDDQLWRLAEPHFKVRNSVQLAAKKVQLRPALEAALETMKAGKGQLGEAGKKFLAMKRAEGATTTKGKGDVEDVKMFLRSFFQTSRLSEGAPAELFRKLSSDETVARVREGGPKAQVNENRPLVQFSGPVRLRKWLADPRGAYTPDSTGQIHGSKIVPLLERLGLTKDELELYKTAGIDKVVGTGRVKVEDVVEWMERVTPKVEVNKLEPNDPSFGTDQLAEAQHELESLGYTVENDKVYRPEDGSRVIDERDLPPDHQQLVRDYWKASEADSKGSSDAATGRYGVEPKELKDMPGAVDILVRTPTTGPKETSRQEMLGIMKKYNMPESMGEKSLSVWINFLRKQGVPDSEVLDVGAKAAKYWSTGNDKELFRGPHFGDSDRNVLASVRGYVETLPSGEKVFHVFEVQSDWGQKASKVGTKSTVVSDKLPDNFRIGPIPDDVKRNIGERELARYKNGVGLWRTNSEGKEGFEGPFYSKEEATKSAIRIDNQYKVEGHPLLAVYEQLALKAAIDHARSLGIKKVAISDAETAMMTEGHDRYSTHEVPVTAKNKQLAIEAWRKGDIGNESWMKTLLHGLTEGTDYGSIRPEQLTWFKDRGFDVIENQVKQAPGMRAAYDERLPRTMEKLVGGKGTLVDLGMHKSLGSPIFKRSDVLDISTKAPRDKDNVTARLYDISTAQPEFAAFGYGKPRVGSTEVSPDGTSLKPGSDEILVNQPAPGRFVEDVTRTVRARVDSLLSRAGYSGTTKQFYTEVAVALAKQGYLPNLDFYRIGSDQFGLAGPENKGRAALGLNVDRPILPGEESKAVLQLMQTLAHEIGHLDGYIRDGLIKEPDAYSEERKRIEGNFRKMSEGFTDDEREAMLKVVSEAVPEQLRTQIKQADGRPYGTSNPDEFMQEIKGFAAMILMHETPAGRAAAMEHMDYMPQEVRDLYRNTFRTMKDVMETMRSAVEDPQVRAMMREEGVLSGNTDPFILSRGFETVLDTARNMSTLRYVDKAMADARSWVTNFDRAPNTEMTNAVWFNRNTMPKQVKAQESFPQHPTDTSVEAVTHAKDFLNGPRAADKAARLGIVMRTLAPFRQEMWALERNGNTAARPIADSIFQLEAGSHRILSDLLSPFMKRNADGSVQFDAENPLIKRISQERTGAFRDTINRVSAWQQGKHELNVKDAQGNSVYRDAQPLFVTDAQGTIIVNPEVKGAQAAWDKMRANLSKDDQAFVMNQSVVLDKLGQRGRDILLTSIAKANVNRVAALLQAMNKKMGTDQALGLATQAYSAFSSGMVMSLQGTIPPKQIEILGRLLTGPDGKSGLLNHWNDVNEHFQNRAGYRSESLPHDWVVRYRTASDEVKFDSRPTEAQALALAGRLQKAGNRIDGEIVNRKDITKLSPTDDPDGILTKVTERENFVWNKFVEEMGQKHGGAFMEELQAGYTPMETTMREVSSRGIGKFLKERQNFVDRDSFDYIDSTMAYAERLAYSVAVRAMKQDVELRLNDPAVRLQPSFQKFVREHMQEFLRPQSQTMKEIKGVATGMFIAGNLSSTVVNATQSLQTLVPVLDLMNGSKGGVAKPWLQLGRAIADATDYTLGHSWKDLAAQTKGVDPSKWTEDQTVAELWRRHVEAGGFTHTVVDDLVYGQDQRLLTNAKFGRGDYGPVTKSSLLRSALYLGNQFAMKPFRWVEHGNAKVAFLAGARQAFEQGLRGDSAYAKAAQVQGLATFGGGRANAPGLQTALSKGFTPGGAGLALALQQYGFGIVAMHGQFVRDALGRSKGLSTSEVWHARRAYGTFLMTQTALAGALGFPLVGAALTALEKVFGIPANQAVRQGLASLSEDDETGAMIAEIGLNGFVDYWTGLDVSSRLGTSSLLGTSSYRGFNWGDLTGPVGSLVEGGVKALGYFGQGEPMKAATALAPAALKKQLELTDMRAKYGDAGFRDKAGNLLYMPTDAQAKAYAFGFRPRELSRRRQMQTALQTADTLTEEKRDHELDLAAQGAIRGDMTLANEMSMRALEADPIHGQQTVLRAIMDRAVAATTEKDALATGSRYNTTERSRIYRTFGPDVQHRRSEMDLQDLRMQMASALGDPRIAPNAGSYKQAAVIDALVNGGSMPRSEAVQIVQMLGL